MELLKEVAKNSAGVAVLELSGINDMLIQSSDNKVMKYVKLGTGWTLIDDAFNLMDNGRLKAQEGDLVWYLDELVFNSAIIGALDTTGVATRINQATNQVLPFGSANEYIKTNNKIT